MEKKGFDFLLVQQLFDKLLLLCTFREDLNCYLYFQLPFIILALVIFPWQVTKTSLMGAKNYSAGKSLSLHRDLTWSVRPQETL